MASSYTPPLYCRSSAGGTVPKTSDYAMSREESASGAAPCFVKDHFSRHYSDSQAFRTGTAERPLH